MSGGALSPKGCARLAALEAGACRELFALPAGRHAALGIAAFIAACAFPESCQRRNGAVLAWKRACFSRFRLDLAQDAGAARRTLEIACERILWRRLTALDLVMKRREIAAAPFWRGPPPRFRAALRRAARQNAQHGARLGRYSASDDANLVRLVWRDSRPVLHLAHALRESMDGEKLHPLDLFLLADPWQERPEERLARLVASAESALRLYVALGLVEPREAIRLTL